MQCGFCVEQPDVPVRWLEWVLGVFGGDQSRESLHLGDLGSIVDKFLLRSPTEADRLVTTAAIFIN